MMTKTGIPVMLEYFISQVNVKNMYEGSTWAKKLQGERTKLTLAVIEATIK